MNLETFLECWAVVATVCAVHFFRWSQTSREAAKILVEYLMFDCGHSPEKMRKITPTVEARRQKQAKENCK